MPGDHGSARALTAAIAAAVLGCAAPAADAAGTDTTGPKVASFGDDGSVTAVASDAGSGTSGTSTTDGTDSSTSGVTPGESSSSTSDTGGPIDCTAVRATVRDFTSDHVDMLIPGTSTVVTGLVLPALGDDGTPTYNPDGASMVITSAQSFAQWYHDVDGVNLTIEVDLPLVEEAPGRLVFDSAMYYPIDDAGFGNEAELHNYFFTTEIHAVLAYLGGESMSFAGDDDVWVFIDGQLVVDLGGKHAVQTGVLVLDDLGLRPGQVYALDVFHAERGVGGSQLRFEVGTLCPR